MNHKQVGVIALVLLCSSVSIGVAQPQNPYSLSGHVYNQSSGAPIEGALVTLTNLRTDDVLSYHSRPALKTNQLGEYQDDASSFTNGFQDGDIIECYVVYEGITKNVTAPIDITQGETLFGICLDLGNPYSLSGHVYNQNSGAPIEGALVTLTNLRTNDVLSYHSRQALKTNQFGEYQDDACNFLNGFKDRDIIKYSVVYEGITKNVTAPIDITIGETLFGICLDLGNPKFSLPIWFPIIIVLVGLFLAWLVNKKEDYVTKHVTEIEKLSIQLLFTIGIALLSCGFIEGFPWCGLIMSIGIIVLAVSLNSLIEKLVGEKNITYVWYCWILVIIVLLGADVILKPILSMAKI